MLFVSVPAMLFSVLVIGMVIMLNLGLEMFVAHSYDGPFKPLVSLLPPCLYAVSVPTLTGFVNGLMAKLNDAENWKTKQEHGNSLGQKVLLSLSLA